jgi:hypothetical protein
MPRQKCLESGDSDSYILNKLARESFWGVELEEE